MSQDEKFLFRVDSSYEVSIHSEPPEGSTKIYWLFVEFVVLKWSVQPRVRACWFCYWCAVNSTHCRCSDGLETKDGSKPTVW